MGGLGLIRLKYVHAFRDRTGRMRYYFRCHGIRTTLPGFPGSKEFMDAYAAQLSCVFASPVTSNAAAINTAVHM